MKNLKYILIFICLFALLALTLTSCSARLSTPRGLYLDEDTQTLKWNKVKGAHGYTIEISGIDTEITTQANYYSLEKLQPGEYLIRVRANGDGKSTRNSGFAKFEFERFAESGLKYQLINNGTEYALVDGGSASGEVVMEDEFRGKPVTQIAESALYFNAKITSFTIGKNVKVIGDKAFTKCSKLTEIVVPENVTAIGEYAFQSCKALKKVTLPNSVTVIEPYTFAWCSDLEEITLGNATTVINEYAFSLCESLSTITYNGIEKEMGKAVMPQSLQAVANSAFRDCLAITSVTFGDNLQVIAPYAFSGATALASIDLGQSVLEIQDAAFNQCASLVSVSIPNSTQVLGSGVFYECTSLTSAQFGTGLVSVGSQVFAETPLLNNATDKLIVNGWIISQKLKTVKNISYDNEIVGIASYAFSGCNELETATFKGVKYVGMAAFVSCQALYRVTFDDALLEIGDYAFASSTVSHVNFGNSLTYIGNYAFQGCKLITRDTVKNITLPDTLTYIGAYAFRNTGLYSNSAAGSVIYIDDWAVDFTESDTPKSIVLNAGTRGIAAYTFSNHKLALVSMPEDVQYICRGAFYKCTISIVNLSPNIKFIDDYAFYDCGGVNFNSQEFALNIPEGTTYIGRSAFYKCTSILSLNIPGSVEYIGPYAFYGCDAIGITADIQLNQPTGEKDKDGNDIYETVLVPTTGHITLGNGILCIDERAFQGCTGIVTLDIPDSVIYIGARAFYKCESLESVTLGSGITHISDYAFYKCISLKNVSTSENLVSVGNYAFRGCTALESFEFNKLETIGRYSFYGCSALKEITIPATLTSIGDYAFRGCTSVSSVVIPDTLVTIGKHAFYNLNETTIYVESKEIQPYWSDRFNSSYRPVFWGCTLSEDGSYVVSFTMGKKLLSNPDATNGISDPTRDGYTFLGWSTSSDNSIEYTSENIATAPEGTVLYAVWSAIGEPTE